MVYVVIKDFNKQGCVCYKCNHKDEMPAIVDLLNIHVDINRIQVVVLNDTSVYGEYAPYTFIDDIGDFINKAIKM